eukprot:18124-Heterococcus_DN1.PRE.1
MRASPLSSGCRVPSGVSAHSASSSADSVPTPMMVSSSSCPTISSPSRLRTCVEAVAPACAAAMSSAGVSLEPPLSPPAAVSTMRTSSASVSGVTPPVSVR